MDIKEQYGKMEIDAVIQPKIAITDTQDGLILFCGGQAAGMVMTRVKIEI